MKRSIFTILITALLLTGLMVSCNSDVSVEQPISGELVAISFDNGGSKGLTASLEAFNKGDYYWAYAAKKADTSNLLSGQTANYGQTDEVRVWVKTDGNNPVPGLGAEGTSGYEAYKVPGFSQGYWNFKLYAYKKVVGDNPATTDVVETEYYVLVYQGETLNALLKSDSVNAQGSHLVSVTVNPVQSEGNGTMVFLTNKMHEEADRISMNTVNDVTYGTNYTVKVLSILSMEDFPVEYVDAAGAKIHEATDSQDGEYSLPTGSYKVTVSFTDEGNTVNYARGTIVATVYSNLTTTIGGDLTEAMTYAEFEENNDVSISDGTTTLYMPLGVFRDSVNSGNSYEGYTVTLLKDVDLGGNEWTPIGTSDRSFSGVFDGQGHTISNLIVNSTSGYAGLFGNVTGTAGSSTPTKYSDVWDDGTNSVIAGSYSEKKYSAVIKKLVVDGFYVKNTSDSVHYSAAVIGYAKDAYISDILVKNGEIHSNYKSAGGVVGASSGNIVLINLTVEDDVSVSALLNGVGGIIGGVNRGYAGNNHLAVIVNCLNKSSVESGTQVCGGIVGNSSDTDGLNAVIIDCINYGEIKCPTRTGGISGDAGNTRIISNCKNYGIIWNDSSSGINYLGGITSTAKTIKILNCYNLGSVIGYAEKMAGIVGQQNSTDTVIIDCTNGGLISNSNPSGSCEQISGGNWDTKTFTADPMKSYTIEDINNIISSSPDYYEYIFTGYRDISGTLNINKEQHWMRIKSDSVICDGITVSSSSMAGIEVGIDNFNGQINGLSGKYLTILGKNNSITIPENTSTGRVSIGASATDCTIVNNGTTDKINLGAAGTCSIVNNGTITHACENEWGNEHTIESHNGVSLTIENHGTISATKGNSQNAKCAYTLLFYGTSNCTVNNIGGGTVTSEYLVSAGNVTINN